MFVTTTAAVVWGSYKKAGRLVGRWRPGSPLVGDTFIVPNAYGRVLLSGVPVLGGVKSSWR